MLLGGAVVSGLVVGCATPLANNHGGTARLFVIGGAALIGGFAAYLLNRRSAGTSNNAVALSAGAGGALSVLLASGDEVGMGLLTLMVLCAFLFAFYTGLGANPLKMLTGDGGFDSDRGTAQLDGSVTCPNCRSLQTEPTQTDMVTDEPLGWRCNACSTTWDR